MERRTFFFDCLTFLALTQIQLKDNVLLTALTPAQSFFGFCCLPLQDLQFIQGVSTQQDAFPLNQLIESSEFFRCRYPRHPLPPEKIFGPNLPKKNTKPQEVLGCLGLQGGAPTQM